jgi:hypothetical protein
LALRQVALARADYILNNAVRLLLRLIKQREQRAGSGTSAIAWKRLWLL